MDRLSGSKNALKSQYKYDFADQIPVTVIFIYFKKQLRTKNLCGAAEQGATQHVLMTTTLLRRAVGTIERDADLIHHDATRERVRLRREEITVERGMAPREPPRGTDR
jgi:hypothetical protein